MGSVATWLIVVNVVVFVLNEVLRGVPALWGYFSAATAVWHLQVWRFITFQFLHANVAHIFFNMLSLYFFGPLIERYLGARRFLAFYVLCGIAGAVMYLLLLSAHILINDPRAPLVGASAGIFGVLIAAAKVAPDARVMLMFPPIPMKLKVLAWVLLGISIYTVMTSGRNAGGEAGHLGGAVLGAALIRKPELLNVFEGGSPRGGR